MVLTVSFSFKASSVFELGSDSQLNIPVYYSAYILVFSCAVNIPREWLSGCNNFCMYKRKIK